MKISLLNTSEQADGDNDEVANNLIGAIENEDGFDFEENVQQNVSILTNNSIEIGENEQTANDMGNRNVSTSANGNLA